MDNASYGLPVCAQRVAVFGAAAARQYAGDAAPVMMDSDSHFLEHARMTPKPWKIVAGAGLALGTVLTFCGLAWWNYVSYVPPYTAAPVRMPSPNGYDDFCAAATMVRASKLKPTYRAPMSTQELRAIAADSAPVLARLRQGFPHEYRTPPVRSFSALFPELAQFREIARRLAATGELAEREGRLADAADAYLDCLRLGTRIPRGGVLIHGLVGLAVQTIGMRPLERLVDRLDPGTSERVLRELVELDRAGVPVEEVFAEEREAGVAGIHELLRQSKSSWQAFSALTGSPTGSPTDLRERLQFLITPKSRMIANYRGYMDQVVQHSGQPAYAAGPLPPGPDDPLCRVLLPIFTQATLNWARRDAAFRRIETRLAARVYQAGHGGAPSTLSALVPRYLPAVPQDPFAPKPLVYRLKGSRVVVYSRGPDGDDDGGKDLGSAAASGDNGDLVSLQKPERGE